MLPKIIVDALAETNQLRLSIVIGSFFGALLFWAVHRILKMRKLESELFMYDQLVQQELLKNFAPEELVPHYNIHEQKVETFLVNECDGNCIDLARVNYLNMLNSQQIKDNAIDCIRKYGIGTCGPPAFYGTTEIHLKLEKFLAEFLNVEEAIVYSYGFAAPSSALIAYFKKKDVIFCDEKINNALEQGIMANKSTVIYFKHNNVDDLRKKLEDTTTSRLQPLRKFLVIEGIYANTGAICPLPEMLTIAKMYKMRIFLDESISFGILGATGRGIAERYSVDISDIDMIIGSLEGALGSVGSFCAGCKVVIEHQRLSSLGYIFSASLATFQAQAAITALAMITNSPEELQHLRSLSKKVHRFLNISPYYEALSSSASPLKVFTLKRKEMKRQHEHEICSFCRAKGVFLTVNDHGLVMHLNVVLYYQNRRLLDLFEILELAADSIKV